VKKEGKPVRRLKKNVQGEIKTYHRKKTLGPYFAGLKPEKKKKVASLCIKTVGQENEKKEKGDLRGEEEATGKKFVQP